MTPQGDKPNGVGGQVRDRITYDTKNPARGTGRGILLRTEEHKAKESTPSAVSGRQGGGSREGQTTTPCVVPHRPGTRILCTYRQVPRVCHALPLNLTGHAVQTVDRFQKLRHVRGAHRTITVQPRRHVRPVDASPRSQSRDGDAVLSGVLRNSPRDWIWNAHGLTRVPKGTVCSVSPTIRWRENH
jgi:hypothetical protein